MAFRTTPSLGPDLEQSSTEFYWDTINSSEEPSPQLGSRVHGSDGFEYIFVKAGASDIAADTQVTINLTTFAAAAGSGGAYTVAAVPANSYFWARVGSTIATS